MVTNANGCTDSSCVQVFVQLKDCPEGIYVPNAFSPNGDNENDLFRVYFGNISCVKEFRIEIYNRLGEEIFQSSEPGFTWEGEYHGIMMNSAVVIYHVYVRFDNENEVSKKGNLSLVR